ncbi:MAG: hypothetical protein MR343_05475 [Clostridia bacterium]|nr:hypothetical protein [Clostridia bacterium]
MFYHGTPSNGFNVFDIGKSKDGSLGKGFYFSGSKEYAKGNTIVNGKFNGKVIEAYLNVKKPYIVNYPGNIYTESLKSQRYDSVYHPGNDFFVVFLPLK